MTATGKNVRLGGELTRHTDLVRELTRHARTGSQKPIAETQQTYDLIASEFARQNSVAAAEVAQRLDELAASVHRGSVVADIGCGPGRDVRTLRARGLLVAGIDLSLGQLRASDVPGLVQADMRRLPLRAGSVDGIWCWAAPGSRTIANRSSPPC
jgi:ubiquinone/menaquinone biosynthesis C-methylase UbiE